MTSNKNRLIIHLVLQLSNQRPSHLNNKNSTRMILSQMTHHFLKVSNSQIRHIEFHLNLTLTLIDLDIDISKIKHKFIAILT